MKLRILNYHFAAQHDSMLSLNTLNESPSISDFDALVCDLDGLAADGVSQTSFHRRQAEIHDLLHRIGRDRRLYPSARRDSTRRVRQDIQPPIDGCAGGRGTGAEYHPVRPRLTT